MATIPTKPDTGATTAFSRVGPPAWPRVDSVAPPSGRTNSDCDLLKPSFPEHGAASQKASHRDALQALIAFSALHEQVRRRKSLAASKVSFDASVPASAFAAEFAVEFEKEEQFVLDEVLRLVAERAVAITGADGLAIALAENNEIVLRATAGEIRPDVGARIDRDSAFSGACFREAQIVTCDDTETDPRVNMEACRRLGARSMVAVPLCGRRRVIGLIEAFSSWPFAFNESDVRNLSLLAELVLGALKPEDEDRFAESAQVAATELENVPRASGPIQSTELLRATAAAPVASVSPISLPITAQPAAPLPAVIEPVFAAPFTPVIETKPIDAAVAVASGPEISDAPAIPNNPATADSRETAPEVKSALASAAVPTERGVELKPSLLQAELANHRLFLPILLLCIVIASAIGGGVWWKMKTAQLGGAMIRTVPADATKATATNSAATAGTAAPIPPTLADESVEALTDGTDPNRPPATALELSKFPRVTGIRHWSSADSSTVVLDVEDQVQYEAHRLSGPDRIYFDLHDTRLAPELAGKSIDVDDTLLSRIRLAQPVSGMTRIVLETKPSTNFSVSLESNPYRLLVEVHKIGTTPKSAVNLFPNAEAEKNHMAIVIPPPTKEDLQLRARVPKLRIVVDAGHGGWDLGTVGRRGLLEKDLVLEIAQRLGKLLESRLGMEVIYTRQDDNYIPLDERASIANQAQADLFVSVHANYSDLPSARGVETYYTNFFSAPGSKEAGAKDAGPGAASNDSRSKDADSRLSGIKPAVTPTLSPADLHERIEQSRRLAASVQRSLYGTLSVQNPGLRDRGIKEAGFVVLTESAMPGILAEVSFVSSPTDEQKLRSDGYREEIAEALYKGIARYAATSKGVKVAAK
jgi:N-acetylmuramoyl-L-alanine amidase/putative methionine-R-sulfoxide reductase with GAF domain